MEPDKTFRTKTGFCHIYPDRIELTRDGVRGNLAKAAIGPNMARILVTYSVLAAVLFYLAFTAYRNHETVEALFGGGLGIFLLAGILRSLNNSAVPVIERRSIKSVIFVKGMFGATRSRFEVLFTNEAGKLKKRLIILPGALENGADESQKALRLMMDENLVTAR